MSLLFVGGVMNVFWMATIASLVLVEKIVSGNLVSRAVGAGLIVGGWLLMLPTSTVGHLHTYVAALSEHQERQKLSGSQGEVICSFGGKKSR